MASRLRRYAKRFGRRAKKVFGRATITAGQVTAYVAPLAAGYYLGPYGVAAGAALGVAGSSLEATGRNLAGKKRQNVRVKIGQGAVRGAALGAVGYGVRTVGDYLSDSRSVVGSNNPQTATIQGGDPNAPAKVSEGGKAATLSSTKAGSNVEFDTTTGQAKVTAPQDKSLLETFLPGPKTAAATSVLGTAVQLLMAPGGSLQTPAPGTWDSFFGSGGGGGGDPGAVADKPDALAGVSPVLLILLAVVAFFVFAKSKR